MKKTLLILIASLTSQIGAFAAVGIGYNANATVGSFRSSTNTSLSLGGVSVGVFTNALSTGVADSFWTSLSSSNGAAAWSFLLANNYRDVRSFATGQPGDWAFPTNMIGTASGIDITVLPANSRLYVIGFDNGSFSLATPSSSWAGALEWGVVSAFGHATPSENFLSPADLGTKTLNFGAAYNLVAGDVKVGTLASGYGTSNRDVLMVPEPSTYALLAISGVGFAGYMISRRRRA
jgi:hypothetical protein